MPELQGAQFSASNRRGSKGKMSALQVLRGSEQNLNGMLTTLPTKLTEEQAQANRNRVDEIRSAVDRKEEEIGGHHAYGEFHPFSSGYGTRKFGEPIPKRP